MIASVVCKVFLDEILDMICSWVPQVNNKGVLLFSTAHWRPLS